MSVFSAVPYRWRERVGRRRRLWLLGVALASLAALTVLGTSGSASASAGYFESFSQAIDSGESLNAITCIDSTSTCVVGDSQGKLYFSTTSTSITNAATWSPWNGPGPSPAVALDCPTSTLHPRRRQSRGRWRQCLPIGLPRMVRGWHRRGNGVNTICLPDERLLPRQRVGPGVHSLLDQTIGSAF